MLTLLAATGYVFSRRSASLAAAAVTATERTSPYNTMAPVQPKTAAASAAAAEAAAPAASVAAKSQNPSTSSAKPIFVFSGPSGSGKSTLIKRLMAEFPDRFAFKVSHTTRQPRPGEQPDVDYHYIDKATIDAMIANKEFIEYATFAGNTYGTSIKSVEDVMKTGRTCLMDIDMQGVKSVKQTTLPNVVYIFVKPPSMQELERRLRSRGTETEEAVQKRLASSKAEMEYAEQKPTPYNHTIVNDTLDSAYEQLKQILITDATAANKN